MSFAQNPYVGPRTFEERDAPNFYGRDAEARNLLARAIADRLVLFYAQTGAGKSSLIHTRLIPGLRDEGFQVLPIGRVGGFPPASVSPEAIQNIYVFNLLLTLSRQNPDLADPAALAATTLSEFLATYQAEGEADPTARVLVIDQFEEILTTHQDRWQEREGFFQQLRQALEDDPSLGVVLALREDFVAALDPYAGLLPARWWRSRFHMNRMDGQAALEAVQQPAAKVGRPFEPGAAEQLVDDLRRVPAMGQEQAFVQAQFIEPVQLQVVCYQIWNNLPPGNDAITGDELRAFGNVDQVLTGFCDQAIKTVVAETGSSEWALRNWFERSLITEAGTRGTVYRGAMETAGLANEVVDALAARYLLRSEPRAGGVWIEIIHDRLVGPIQASNRDFMSDYHNPLDAAFRAWNDGDRDESLLLDYAALREAETFAKQNPADATDEERTFLQLSRQVSEERQKKSSRQGMIALLAVVVVLALLCAVAVIIALQLSN